ncbi:MAG: translation elongation factor Ts [Nitrospirae bacterium]|nr:translation elongation factor Ts [Nitrospirota bacterium]
MVVDALLVKDLREKTGAGIMECKKALSEGGGDINKAIDLLRQRGLSAASKKADRVAGEGAIGSYIHTGGKLGVLAEVNCETDFVARNDEFKEFVKDIAMQIAAASPSPLYVKREDVPPEVIEKEREIYRAQAKESGKPANVIEKIVDGKLEKFYTDFCLTEQVFIKDTEGKLRIKDIVSQKIAKFGENIVIRRFVRFKIGEANPA